MTTHARIAAGLTSALCVILLVLTAVGCGEKKKIEPVKVGEMETFRDPAYGYSLHYPKGWIANTQVGRASFYSAQDVEKKFLEPTGPNPDGVKIMVDLIKTTTPDQEKKRVMDEMKANGFVLTPEQPVTVGGKTGTRFTYTGQYTKSVKEAGEHLYFPLDTLMYDIHFAGFGGLYDAHRDVFAAALGSFQFPKPIAPGRDATLPAETMADYNGKLLSFQYPENFNFTNVPKGNNEEVVELRGVRLDCSIRLDVFPAKGLTLEKVFDQNKGKYRATATGKASLGGQPALTLTYPASGNVVERRFYFAVKNDKVYRVTMDWYKPQREEYLAAYDKVINSIKIK